MGFRDDSEAIRARAEALDRENQDLRQQLERESASVVVPPSRSDSRQASSTLWLMVGIAFGLMGAVLLLTRRIPLGLLPLPFLLSMLFLTLGMVSRLVCLAGPNEVLVISGRPRRLLDGRIVGYRVLRGGRAIRIPLLERVDRLGLETILVQAKMTQVYTRGGIPLSLTVNAAVKISAEERVLANAVERFLGQERAAIQRVAHETVEGGVRGVLATLSPDELQQDSLRVQEACREELDDPMARLGLVVDTLELTDISRPA